MARFGRSQPFRPHLAPPIVAPGGPAQIVTPVHARVFNRQALDRPYRNHQRFIPAHLAKPVVAPGGPVRIPAVFQAKIVSQAVERPKRERLRVIPPHLAKPVVAAAAAPTLPSPAVVVGQALQKLLERALGRVLPRPRRNLTGAVVPFHRAPRAMVRRFHVRFGAIERVRRAIVRAIVDEQDLMVPALKRGRDLPRQRGNIASLVFDRDNNR